MRFFKTGSFEGIPRHRMQGTKVTLAGRTAFLPNRSTPLVIQDSETDVAADCFNTQRQVCCSSHRTRRSIGRYALLQGGCHVSSYKQEVALPKKYYKTQCPETLREAFCQWRPKLKKSAAVWHTNCSNKQQISTGKKETLQVLSVGG